MKDPPSHKSRHDLGIPLLASFRSLEISNKRWKCKELNGLWFLFDEMIRTISFFFDIFSYQCQYLFFKSILICKSVLFHSVKLV